LTENPEFNNLVGNKKIFMKVFKIIIVVIMVFILIIIGWTQNEAENYIKNQKEKFGILENRKRISYLPFSIFILSENDFEKRAFNLPYAEKKLNEYASIGMYDYYIIHCFYSNDEIEFYLKSSDVRNAESVWWKFLKAIEEKNIEYLIENSYDTIFCTDCILDLKESSELYESKLIYQNNIEEFADIELLKQSNYSIYATDSLFRVNFKIEESDAEEGAYNIVFTFLKHKHKFKLRERFTIP
jgi:hypothetical protein